MTPRTVEKVAVVVVVVVLGTALAVNVRGLPVVLLIGALVVTVCAGMDLVLRGEARYRPTADLFILPSALVVGAVLFISLLATGTSIVIGLACLGLLLLAVFWAELVRLGSRPDAVLAATGESASRPPPPEDAETRSEMRSARPVAGERRLGETVLVIAGFLAAFVLFAAVYQFKTRSLLSSPAIITISFLLGARQLRLAHEPGGAGATPDNGTAPRWPRTLIYAAAVALCTGQVAWALNYWPLNGLLGGAFLLAVFYFLIGVFSQHLQERLNARLLAEYGVVSSIGLVMIALAGLVRPAA